MYHYHECGLTNVYLTNGYREVDTPYGLGIAIEDVQGLHKAIASDLVKRKPALSGAEVKFMRKFLQFTQLKLAGLLGVDDQTLRRWETLEELPKHADRTVRLVLRDVLCDFDPPLEELFRRIGSGRPPERYQYRRRAKDWTRDRAAALSTVPVGAQASGS